MKMFIDDVSSVDVMWNGNSKSQIIIRAEDESGSFFDLYVDKEQAQKIFTELQKVL
jgi:hypothetical protein